MTGRRSDLMRVHLGALVALAPGPSRLRPAIKAAITVLLCLAVSTAFGRLDLGLLCVPGTFAVLYAPEAPMRRRVATVATIGAGLVGATVLGAYTASSPVLFAVLAVAVAMGTAGLCLALRVGPPGSYFLVLCAGIAHYLAREQGISSGHIVGLTAVGAVVALVVTLVELVPDPRRPERRAVDVGFTAVEAYAASTPGPDGRPLHRAASHALATAEEAVAEGAWSRDPGIVSRLAEARRAYELRARRAAEHFLPGDDLAWDPRNPDAARWVETDPGTTDVDLPSAASVERAGRAVRANERRHIRSLRLRLRDGLHYPGEPWSVALSVGVATSLAILALTVVAGTGQAHLYWVIAVAALVLHQGGPRVARTYRAIHRLVGTLVGLGVFVLLALAQPSGWWMVAVIVGLQFAIELLVTRNYGLAVALITPLALLVSTGGRFGEPWTLAGERLLDTVVGVGAALLVVWTIGRRAHHRAVRGGTARVLRELADHALGCTPAPMEPTLPSALRDLHSSTALLSADGHGDSVEARTAEAVVLAGYLVLGAADRRAGMTGVAVLGALATAPLPSGRRPVPADNPVDVAIRDACSSVGVHLD